MFSKDMLAVWPFLLKALGSMKLHSQSLGEPQLSNNPGHRFTGRSGTFKKNLRVVQKAQRRRVFYRSLRKKGG